MSSAGNCEQINLVRDGVSDNMKREQNNLDKDFFCEAFGRAWSGDLILGFAVGMSVHGEYIYVFRVLD
jgi:hypothetical protein